MAQKAVVFSGVKMNKNKRKKTKDKELKTNQRKFKKKVKKTINKPEKPKKPNQLSERELARICGKFQDNHQKGLLAILEMDDDLDCGGHPFHSFILNLLTYKTIYTDTTYPYWNQFWQLMEKHPSERDSLKQRMNVDLFDEPFVFINQAKLLSSFRELVSGGGVGKFKSKLREIHKSYYQE